MKSDEKNEGSGNRFHEKTGERVKKILCLPGIL